MSRTTLSEKLSKFSDFSFDVGSDLVVNNKSSSNVNVEEFLEIQNILDNNRVHYEFRKNFQIQIIRKS